MTSFLSDLQSFHVRIPICVLNLLVTLLHFDAVFAPRLLGSRALRPRELGGPLQIIPQFLDEVLVEVVVGIFQELVEDEPVADVAPGQDKPQTAPHVLVILVSNLWRDNGIDRLLGCHFTKFFRDIVYLGID